MFRITRDPVPKSLRLLSDIETEMDMAQATINDARSLPQADPFFIEQLEASQARLDAQRAVVTELQLLAADLQQAQHA